MIAIAEFLSSTLQSPIMFGSTTPGKASCNLKATLGNCETDNSMQNILPKIHRSGDGGLTDRVAAPPSHQNKLGTL